MNPLLRDRIVRTLDTMTDERAYQVLDYIEFLESKYAVRPSVATAFQRFAEGIEDSAQLELLKAEHCDKGQGFLFARPLSAADLSALLQTETETSAHRPRTVRKIQPRPLEA